MMMGLKTLFLVAAAGAGRLVQAQTASTPPGPTFTGSPSNCNKWYVISDGDNCSAVETKFGITHAQFIAWNPAVSNDCLTNFWLGQAYCVSLGTAAPTTTTTTSSSASTSLPGATTPPGPTFTGSPSNCNRWYLIADGDNCGTVEAKFGITHAQFIAWNPAVSQDCVTNFWLGQAYCVGLGPLVTSSTASSSGTSSSSSITIVTPTTPYSTRYPVTNQTVTQPSSSEAWPPSKTQAGQPSYCNNWHFVQGGQTCGDIVALYGTWMTSDDFYAWNPAVGQDCSGLYVYYWVCVGIRPQAQISLPYETGNATVELPPYFTWAPEPTPTDLPDFAVPSPTQGPLPDNCVAYFQAGDGDRCSRVVDEYPMVTEEQFLAWHPFLGGNCDGLWVGYWYCGVAFARDELPMPPTVTAKPSPVPTGTASNCAAWYLVTPGDTCALVSQIFGTFSVADFIGWNPSVGGDCSGIATDMYYCVGVPGTPTTRTTPVPEQTAPPAEDLPTQEGIASDCTSFWLVSSADTCSSIASQGGITLADFKAWNPAVGDACDGLKPDFYVCVGRGSGTGTGTSSSAAVPSTTTASRTSSSAVVPSTTTSSGAVATPTPIQGGMVSGCKEFYFVKSGDGCWAIANDHGIALSDFYLWNPAVNTGGECAGLWPDVYVCVGV
ncbi:LysM domain-containing protein [Colletotrichum tofieldiae]|uniref:LysM domain-containing protein n=1 Tax=Colletotrichum tofieldiae TaxID=708197 RepID=A0A166V6K3_9PEZI|nr:LysM domain-containing protein [Colletotrichum tofieldiae]